MVCILKGPGCFAAGTPVLTPGGSVAIEHLRPGDLILAAPEDDPEAEPQPRVVEDTFQNYLPTLDLTAGGRTIRTTAEHPFWIHGRGWVAAQQLRPGDRLKTYDGGALEVQAVDGPKEATAVYNMSVADYHTYFVGSPLWGFSVWTHNSKDCPVVGAPIRRAPAPDNYRGRYMADRHAQGQPRLPDDWDVHHRIPQRYMDHPEYQGFDFHQPGNLRGVQGSRSSVNTHQQITNAWEDFARQNPNATRAQIENFANQIDSQFSGSWF